MGEVEYEEEQEEEGKGEKEEEGGARTVEESEGFLGQLFDGTALPQGTRVPSPFHRADNAQLVAC